MLRFDHMPSPDALGEVSLLGHKRQAGQGRLPMEGGVLSVGWKKIITG